LWSHVLWIIGGRATDERKYARDILSDPITALLSNRYWWFAASGLLLPAVMGYIAGGVQECARCLLWAGFARVALLQQFTWSVNSIGHCLGEILPGAKDQSRNNLVLAILTLGGGLHSYHHKHPAAAVNRPASWDPLGGLILALEKVGLIWRVRKFSD
jgi:stearoyl-CoA desaturase (delta-9 desaturase)